MKNPAAVYIKLQAGFLERKFMIQHKKDIYKEEIRYGR